MNDVLADLAPAPRHLELTRRAEALQVPCWCLDAEQNVTASSLSAEGATDPNLLTTVTRAARAGWVRQDVTHVGLVNGVDLLVLPDAHGVVVADLAASVLPREQLIAILTQYHTDLLRAAKDAEAIEGFSEQLSQSYEQVNLIFRMAKLLTSSGDPRQVVQTMCEELRDTLHYGWLSMMFAKGDAVLPSLRDAALHSGRLPCSEAEMVDKALTLNPTESGRVILPAQNELAALSGSELLAERVMHDGTPIGILVAGNREGDDPDVTSNELQLVEAAAGFFELFHENAFRFAQQRQQFLGTLHALSAAVDAKDPYTHGHSARVGLLASQLAEKLSFAADQVEMIRVAGLLHDIGKIGVPEAVLRKPAKLDDAEFALIQQHPEIGYHILKDLPSLSFHLPGVLHHHERWDGRGYPHKLAGEQIPVIARMLAFADTFDAMSSSRSYRHGMERSRVLAEIRKSGGTQFDPAMVEPFLSLDFTKFDRMLAA
ncbi:MAG TPA: HD-GYP domain-containing protein [Tepidisphaeraceae bacterium]